MLSNMTGRFIRRESDDHASRSDVASMPGRDSTPPELCGTTERRLDSAAGPRRFRLRFMDPVQGRFLQRDRTEGPPDTNEYEYSYDSPPDYVDPWGDLARAEEWWKAVCKLEGAPAGYDVHHLYDADRQQLWTKCKIDWDANTNKCALLSNINSSLGNITKRIDLTGRNCEDVQKLWNAVISCEKQTYASYMFCESDLPAKCGMKPPLTENQTKKCCCDLASAGAAGYNKQLANGSPLPNLQQGFETCLKNANIKLK